ncbi:sulfotransferase family protein [Aspergillus novofumigatus IBT 16806]|uniref:P-loop containing nucleoside triphosphate hydrolase protein n=1 Tax=Aspergillus novofumigatus (strain IBT 16806) TaxID=1392255 RepID=A0A2I1BUL3_ASPN1|nr:uncharacterized protein P174DRAFT_379526 [Aspergillus novofumigatus IBT 16806]PKX89090.1 hypothetical protein P174DRAFT_379526 [Aspergillus novofumigatus IBT 16806]
MKTGRERRRIVGAGLPRTGTTSLAAALRIVGYDATLHAHQGMLGSPDANASKLEEITGISLQKLTFSYMATMDSPLGDFYAELAELYPDSLVILTTRDTDEQWWTSWNNTLGVFYGNDWRGRLLRALLLINWNDAALNQMCYNYASLWRSKYEGYGPHIHRLRELEVRRYIPTDRLLIFNVKEGWAPLCKFLEVEVPAQPFPWM